MISCNMYYYILSCGLYYSIYLTLGLTIERCIILLLNQRQLEILLELFEKPEVYMTASYFSSKHQCSLRTIQMIYGKSKLSSNQQIA